MTSPESVFSGNAIFAHAVPSAAKGSPAALAALLKELGFDTYMPKIVDGQYVEALSWSPLYKSWGVNVKPELVNELHRQGIKVVGFAAPYGGNPTAEAQITAKVVNELGLDGIVFDIETTFENKSNAVTNTHTMMTAFKKLCSAPVCYCSWARFWSPTSGANWHPVTVAKAWLQYADAGMPMAYWYSPGGPNEAVSMLEEAIRQWSQLTSKPLCVAGRAYNGDGGNALPSAVKAFAETARQNSKVIGLSWWVLDQAVNMPEILTALKQANTAGQPVVVDPDSSLLEQLIALAARVAGCEGSISALIDQIGIIRGGLKTASA